MIDLIPEKAWYCISYSSYYDIAKYIGRDLHYDTTYSVEECKSILADIEKAKGEPPSMLGTFKEVLEICVKYDSPLELC